ncbi:AEX-3 domain-containing protein, partial [Vararia minispora EC-137]
MSRRSFGREARLSAETAQGRGKTLGASLTDAQVPGRKQSAPSQRSLVLPAPDDGDLADELDYISVSPPSPTPAPLVHQPRDKASRILGIRHRASMEPIPASARTSVASTRSAPARDLPPPPSFTPTTPLASLYVVSGLPKSPHTWTLADPDSVLGLSHSEGAVSRWWRAEVLGSTVSPGVGGGRKKRRGKETEVLKGAGALAKQEVAKMLSKALKLSFTREVEIVASTLQPASTVHSFSFSLPAPASSLAPATSTTLLRQSALSAASSADRPTSAVSGPLFPYDPFTNARPSSAYLGPPALFPPAGGAHKPDAAAAAVPETPSATVAYHGVCLTVWSHADADRTAAIRRTLEASRSRKESAQSLVAARLRGIADPGLQARRSTRRAARGPWAGPGTDAETDADAETDGAMSESDFEAASVAAHNPGESTLFLPGDTVFWLPYALTLVSRHPIYDLMRDYLTLSWARFSKDVQSHTLQIAKILAHPAPRAGDLIRLDASASASPSAPGADTSLEVIARFPGGLDFGRGLVDVNFTMWPLFKALNIDNVLTACEIALAPTGRVLFFSRHPAMLAIAVSTLRYLVELRGWSGVALQAVHARDAKIYTDDPGPWIIGLATEARYAVRPPPEVCIVDIDINYLSCAAPAPGAVSTKTARDRARARLLQAFEPHYHPDHAVPSEFKEAFPAGRFRPVCKIQAKRGGSSAAAVADTIRPPDWWHSTRVIQAFDAVLQQRTKKPGLFKRISSFGAARRTPQQLSAAEQHVQMSIRKRATAFVDARDDLETKIGRLSRRLNFLMTESDLWRDKFVTFEQYAEKLSSEANELRAKINREQRETKRLSGLVTMTAAEKAKLQGQLRETEGAHRDALGELQRMREAMETMEQERAAMVAEVEAQIERALASMAVDIDSDYDSRPPSRASSRSRSRRPDDAGARMRSFGTDSTLVEAYAELDGAGAEFTKSTLLGVKEEEDEQPLTPSRAKRFSAIAGGGPDVMQAVDEGITERSDNIAKKVLQIQQKVRVRFF